MRRSLMLLMVEMLAGMVFVPTAFAQDDNPTGDDLGGDDRRGERGFDGNLSGDDLREDDRDGIRGLDDNPTGDAVVASPTATAPSTASASSNASATASAKASATSSPGTDATAALPNTGGTSSGFPLPAAAGALLIGSSIVAVMLLRRRNS